MQGHDGQGALVAMPPTSAYVDVCFHRTTPAQLAARSPIITALLEAKPRVTKGSHRVPMTRLVAAAKMSSSAVRGRSARMWGACMRVCARPMCLCICVCVHACGCLCVQQLDGFMPPAKP